MHDAWFFCFDGIDGAGKTTQIERFRDWLQSQGQETVVCRDPGSTPLGEQIREILLSHSGLQIGVRSEMLLYMAARAQLVEEIIRPAMSQGKSVISDRFLLANVVYQGHAGGLDVDDVWRVGAVATGDLAPHRTFVLDLPTTVAAKRRTTAPDRMEGRGEEFLSKVRDGFLREARSREGIEIIDAAQDAHSVQEQIRGVALQLLAQEGET